MKILSKWSSLKRSPNVNSLFMENISYVRTGPEKNITLFTMEPFENKFMTFQFTKN